MANKSKEESKLSLPEELKLMEDYHIMHPKSFMLAAGKIDKISGDIRVCFEILRESV
jgi:biotin synthase-like enzyme